MDDSSVYAVDNTNPYHSLLFSDEVSKKARKDAGYEQRDMLPTYPKIVWPVLELQENLPEPGLHGLDWKNGKLLKRPGIQCTAMSPTLGTELSNIDLRTLDEDEKNELGAMLADRGLVVFRRQPGFSLDDQTKLVQHFGPLYMHPAGGIISEELPHIRILYQGPETKTDPEVFSADRQWHRDSPYELNPPGVVSMKLFTAPPSGGDTVFTSGYELYDSLSPGFQKYLDALVAENRPGFVDPLNQGFHTRRPMRAQLHPLVCVHPVTGWKTVFADRLTTHRIVGLPRSESQMLINFLGGLVMERIDAQVRLRWDDATVALWDNRCVFHSATFNFWPHRRHASIITAISNKPISVEDAREQVKHKYKSRQEANFETTGFILKEALN